MFDTVSWQGYGIVIFLLTVSYYLTIYLLYFRNDFKVSFRRGAISGNKNSYDFGSLSFIKDEVRTNVSLEDSEEFQTPVENNEKAVVYACIDELDAFFSESKKSKFLKEDIVFALQGILKKYPSLKTSPYKLSLTHVIVGQCENICSIHLKADDVDRVWFG